MRENNASIEKLSKEFCFYLIKKRFFSEISGTAYTAKINLG